jgi:hypothetical protein
MQETPNTNDTPKGGSGEMAVNKGFKIDIRYAEDKRDEASISNAGDFEKPLVAPPKKDEISNKL